MFVNFSDTNIFLVIVSNDENLRNNLNALK